MAEKEKKVKQSEDKPAKPEKKKGRIKEAWRGFKSEVKKVVWPSGRQVLKNTLVVLVIVLICALIIAALDYAFSNGISVLAELINNASEPAVTVAGETAV